jgi:hypothetical protein
VDIPVVSAVRRNHAIEHATIAVLFERRRRTVGVLGRSDAGGFTVHGPFSADEVASAADEAVRRLRDGESHLAVTHLCGTNLAVTAILAGSAALFAAGSNRREGWSRALSAALGATLVSGRVGLAVQRYVTTNAAIGRTRVSRVREVGRTRGAHRVRVELRQGA